MTYQVPASIPLENDSLIDFEPNYELVLQYDVLRRLYTDREDTRLASIEAKYSEAWEDYRSYISRQTDTVNGLVRTD